jgi:hypothetical protein
VHFLVEQGVSVIREDTRPANGYYHRFLRRITLDERFEGDRAAKTLTHETAHMVADHSLGIDPRDAETVAESAAFLVLNHAGIDGSGYSFPYPARWAQDRIVLKRNLDAVQKTVHLLIDALEQQGSLPDHEGSELQIEEQGENTRQKIEPARVTSG